MRLITANTFIFFLFILFSVESFAQKATIRGIVTDANGTGIPHATVMVENLEKVSYITNEAGAYILTIPADKPIDLIFKHVQFLPERTTIVLAPNEIRVLDISFKDKVTELSEVAVTGQKLPEARQEAGTIKVSPNTLKSIPTPFGDFNQQLISGGALGISGNSELSSAYSVRGGSFDENLVYVNNIQIYRPFLVRAGQQEGLSFVNSEMVQSVAFSSGGWQPKYGDKLSSVLNINYKTPKQFGASLNASLLGGGLQVEGASKNQKFTYVTGLRYKTSEYLLNTLETDGQYLPRFGDIQTYLQYDLSRNGERNKTVLGVLASYASNRYKVVPETRTTRFGTFQDVKNLTVAFDGRENMDYDTFQGGLKLSHRFADNFNSDFIVSVLNTSERENIDLEGGYRICDVDNNPSSSTFNQCVLVTGIGTQYHYARNALDAEIYSAENRNKWHLKDNMTLEFGMRVDHEKINDTLHEYEFLDSADYVIELTPLLSSHNTLDSYRYSAYLQNSVSLGDSQTLTFGARTNYWSVNKQWLFSPRVQYSVKPEWEKDIILSMSAGLYHQPPFYREMRDFQGNLNTDLKAQSSAHIIAGLDYNFEKWGRPFKLISEVYYKYLWNVVPYDVDDLRLRYYATNSAVAYATGLDLRLSGEFIPDTESWMSLSIMSTKEDLEEDSKGYIRRPTDQRVTFTLFFRDHLPNNPTMQMHFRLLYGSGLPFGPPNNLNQRNILSSGTDYKRVDIGFSKHIDFGGDSEKSIIKDLSIGLEILNVIGSKNNISYTWIKDFNNIQYAVPNSLSQRFFNVRMLLRH
ncbi:carboxypeptidase regulatory-like domain-containing protein [Limibacter armeniacum]|uniref:TonB-dependent receptor n=1 Tax=Limibacter armeniacum TaxID=466084 RepID=UPI002FE6A9DE